MSNTDNGTYLIVIPDPKKSVDHSDDAIVICDIVDNVIVLVDGLLEGGTCGVVYAIYGLYKAVDGIFTTKKYYNDTKNKFDDLLDDEKQCMFQVKINTFRVDENTFHLEFGIDTAKNNSIQLDALNSTINDGFTATYKHLDNVDKKVQDIANKLDDSTNQILDSIESAKRSIINQMHDTRTEKILADLSSFLEFIMLEARQIQSLPLHMRIAKIKKEKGFIDLLIDTTKPDKKSMLFSLTKIIDFDIAIPKDITDKLSFSMLELLCHGVDVYVFIVAFLIQHFALVAVDYFYKSDIDNYNVYMAKSAGVYSDFSVILIDDDQSLLPRITTEVLNKVKNGDFISGNEKMRELVDLNLNKIELIKNFFIEMKSHSDIEAPTVEDIKFDSDNIKTPILDWKSDSQVSYALQHWGNKTTPTSKVSEWKLISVAGSANPYVKLLQDTNTTRTRAILRKFDEGYPQIVALITNSSQRAFHDIDRDLFNAVHEPNVEMAWKNFQIYLNNGANVSAMFEHGKRAIHVATENNNWQIAQALIKNGANINEIDESGLTPIYIATEAGYEQFVDELIELKADVNSPTGLNNYRFTPLHSAVFKKHTNILRKLLQVPSINIHARTTDGVTLLNLAVLNNNDQVIDICLNKNNIQEIVDIQSVNEFPPIYFAYKNNNEAVANKLIDQCANVNVRLYDDKTLLHLAVMYSHSNVVEKLIDNFDVSVKDVKERTPLHYAVMKGDEDLTRFLLAHHADPNAKDIDGTPVIIFTVNLPESKVLAIIKALNENKVNINDISSKTKNTILHIACVRGHLSVVQFLIENQAQVNLLNKKNETPLHLASKRGYLEIVKCLLEQNANVDIRNQHNETALHLAAKIGHLSIVRSLIESNATFTTVSDTNETAVEYAVKGEGNLDMFKYFVEAVYKESADKDENGLVMANCYFLAQNNIKNDIVNYYLDKELDECDKCSLSNILNRGAIESLKGGNLDSIKEFLNMGFMPNILDKNSGWTMLYYVIMGKGGLGIVNIVLEKPLYNSLTVDDKKYGKTLLHLAIETKKVNVAKLLLDKKADFNNADFEDDTQLHYAAKYGLHQIADQLVGKLDTSSINKKNKQGKTPLFVGVEGEANLNLIQFLIDAGVRLDGDNDGQSLLDAAIVANKTDAGRLFKGQSINQTNLHVAASNNNIELVDLLLDEKDIDIDLEDGQKRKPIYSAVEGNGTLAMIQHLISKKANMNNFDQSKCDNLITLAIQQKKLDVAMYLIGVDGADINKVGKSQISPLYQAISVDNSLFAAVLLEKGADYDFKLDNFTAPIDLIVDNKSNTIKFFTMMYRNEHNQTMLHLMAMKNRVKVVKKLLERGAYVNVQDNDGNSPLHLAAKNGRLEIVKMMCEMKQKCLNVALQNANKQTALDLAKSAEHTEVVDYLEHKCHPKQRDRREIVEHFSEPPVSSSAGRPSWWVSDLVASVVSTFESITDQSCHSVLSSSYYESRTASAQSISSLSASVNVHSTLLLLDVLARKVTGQSYVCTDSQSDSQLHARSNSLVIVEKFERMLNRLASETNSQLVPEFDSFELYRSVEQCLLSGQYSKIDRILLSTARDAFPSDSVEDSLLVASVEELLIEVLSGKNNSSLAETSSM